MVNFVDDPQQRGRELEDAINRRIQQASDLITASKATDRYHEAMVAAFRIDYDGKLDRAFSALHDVTVGILSCTDEDLNAISLDARTSTVIAALVDCQKSFTELKDSAAQVLQQLGFDSQDDVADKEKSFVLREELTTFMRETKSELDNITNTRNQYWNDFERAQREFEDIEGRLREWDDKDFFSQMFSDNPHDELDGRRGNAERHRNDLGWRHTHMRELMESVQRLVPQLSEAIAQLDEMWHSESKEAEVVIGLKGLAAEEYDKVYDFKVLLSNPAIQFSVEDALRHIIQLLYSATKIIDSDEDTKRFKALILGAVAAKYGVEKTEELKQERKYLEFDI